MLSHETCQPGDTMLQSGKRHKDEKMSCRKDKSMPSPDEQLTKDWWAEGDTPVRSHNSRVTYLVDGRTAMLTMCRHFLKARNYIYIAGWGMTPLMELVR